MYRDAVIKPLFDGPLGRNHTCLTLVLVLSFVRWLMDWSCRVQTVRDTVRDWQNLLSSARAILVLRQCMSSMASDVRASHTVCLVCLVWRFEYIAFGLSLTRPLSSLWRASVED